MKPRAIFLIVGLLPVLSACAADLPRDPDGKPPLVIAHRGAPTLAPENTLAAVRAALDLRSDAGALAIEIDIRRSADGVPVAIHDADLERTTDGSGEVAERSWRELQALDAGSWFGPDFAGEPLPSLEQVLALVSKDPGKTVLIVELKDGGEGFEAKVVDLLQRSGLPAERLVLKAFERDILAELERLAPEYPKLYVFVTEIGWLNLVIDEQPRFVDPLDVPEEWLQVHSSFLDRDFVIEAQERGYKVIAWNVHETGLMKEMLAWGVDGIETDHPGELLDLIEAGYNAGASAPGEQR